jgi:murein L,D-transpeptidase YcbB/YkuD
VTTTRPSRLACVSLLVLLAAIAIVSAGAAQPGQLAAAQSSTAATASRTVFESEASTSVISAAISRRLTSGRDLRPLSSELNRLYDTTPPAPLWVDQMGRPSRAAAEGLRLLRQAGDEGLDPHDYDAGGLARSAVALEAAPLPEAEDAAAFDVALSAALLRYLRHLHLGRVDPRTIGFRVRIPDDSHDFAALLRTAVAEDRVAKAAADLAPMLAQYRALRAALATYRSLASAGIEALPSITTTVRPGEPYAERTALSRRLQALGDLPEDPAPLSERGVYDGAVVTAIKRFQIRHGLEPDGVLGRATQAALRVPLEWRIRQIELALERLRWLPDLGERRFIALNIPMFTLWAWDSIPPTGAPSFGMRAIVGRALNTQTPVFVEEMRHVIFRPYWNVPRSILRNEILPLLARDAGYLRRHDLEMVRGQSDDAHAEADTAENHALLRQGVLRLRQRPGPRNSLGLVKFVFPNDANVYMHGTPAQELFGRSRRDFSHGCVRVEDPAALATWILKNEPAWNQERILTAMAGSTSQRVNLANPIQVILFYVTAVVMPEDGTIHFAEDIYRHDLRLDRALVSARFTHALQSSR